MSNVCYTSSSYLKIADIHRYKIKYKLYEGSLEDYLKNGSSFVNGIPDKITVTITNTIPLSMRATGVLIGPYSLYVDLKKKKYNHKEKYFEKSDIPIFEPNLLPSQDIIFDLYLNDLHEQEIEWELDIISQALFTKNCKTYYKVDIKYNFNEKIYIPNSKTELELLKQNLTVTKLDSLDIWRFFNTNRHLEVTERPMEKTHLVILTHGMMSNVTADMLYLAEQIKMSNDDCHITGFTDNVCKTERGVRYQGIKNAEFIYKEINKIGVENISKLSFIGHSLGGLVQLFAVSYLFKKYPEVMYKLKLENFIALASPLLGVLNENPKIFAKLLHIGIIGKSGQDLGLIPMMEYNNEPFLSVLLCAHTRNILRRFANRTVYANSVNDGVVPLYTSSLLFIEFDDVRQKMKEKQSSSTDNLEVVTEDYYTEENSKKRNKYLWKPLMKLSTLFAPNMNNESPQIQEEGDKNETDDLFELPKMSLFDTAQNVLLQPVPKLKYIIDPSSRDSTIIHDKVYTEEMVNKIILSNEYKKMIDINLTKDDLSESFQKELEIAKKWHHKITWRKVVCALEPDAHNNINVRRNFHNAYGWEVIDHMISEHFTKNSDEARDEEEVYVEETDDVCDYYWLLNFDDESLIDGGVTGMIPTISDLVDRWYNKLRLTVGGDESEREDELSRRMSEFSIEEQEILFNYIR